MSGKRKLTGGPGAPEAIAGLAEKALREAQAQRLQALQAEVEAIDDVPRPCPYTRCRYHLLADSHRFDDAADMPAEESCALDVAEDGPHTLEQIGKILGVSSSGSA